MSCSLQALKGFNRPQPVELFSETKIINHTGEKIALIVAFYSLGGKEFANSHFSPDLNGNFIVTQAPCYLPEEAEISLFGYVQNDPPRLVAEKHLLFTEFFSRKNHDFWG